MTPDPNLTSSSGYSAILEYFDQISEAPDAVPRLRRFILDLAVRGKLVEQNPNDEPAAELLKRIDVERERLIAEGEYKRDETFQSIADEEIPFTIPKNWSVVRMGLLAKKLGAGSTPLGGKSVYQDEGVPFLRSQNVHDNGLRLNEVALISRTIHNKMSGTHIQQQDILLNITGASIGRCALVPKGFKEGNVSQHVSIIRLILAEIREFTHLSLISPFYQKMIMEVQVGVSREGLSMQRLRLFPILLPPLSEQHRIAAKVDELMKLCDELEAAKYKRERRRDQLITASLTKLTDETEIKSILKFSVSSACSAVSRPEHIHQLRQTILNLAVRGKLVPQNPKDEPASELLKRIKMEKFQRAINWMIGREHKLSLINEKEIPFTLPAGWAWARFPELGTFGRGKSKHRPRNDPPLFEGGTHLVVQTGDVARSNGLIKTFTGKYNEVGLAQSAKWPKGTLCITIAANIADSGVLSFDACFPDSVVGFVPAPVFPNARYFEYFIRTAKTKLIEFAPATAQKNINLGILNEVLIPLPPLAEQHRIVARVAELMALCDEMESRLFSTATIRQQLLEATLHGTLSIQDHTLLKEVIR